jgi:hypothetical protein
MYQLAALGLPEILTAMLPISTNVCLFRVVYMQPQTLCTGAACKIFLADQSDALTRVVLCPITLRICKKRSPAVFFWGQLIVGNALTSVRFALQ